MKTKIKKTYQELKETARNIAIEWQSLQSEQAMTWGECAAWGDYFERLGRRYGLLREFRENGIC